MVKKDIGLLVHLKSKLFVWFSSDCNSLKSRTFYIKKKDLAIQVLSLTFEYCNQALYERVKIVCSSLDKINIKFASIV
jgi:hypothetical protein